MTPPPPRSTVRVRTAIVVAAVAVIALFPVAALDNERPSFLGWHMYAAVVTTQTITVTYADGSTATPSLGELAARIRPEIDYSAPAAAFICSREAGAVTVRVDREHPESSSDFACETF